jgi:hypothetical protein
MFHVHNLVRLYSNGGLLLSIYSNVDLPQVDLERNASRQV